jgi:apolipoprotein N-acyltransferase
MAFVAGGLLNLAFAPFEWWSLGLLAPAVLFALIRGLPPRRAATAGAAFGVGVYAFGTYWLYTCLHVFGLVPLWLTLLLQALLVCILSVYTAALCYAANRLWLKPGAIRDWLVLPALWVLLEWLRGWVLSGFPWLSLGYAFIDSPLAGWAPLLGVYGVTWAAAASASGLNVLFGRGLRWPRRLAALAMVAVLCLAPALLLHRAWTAPVGRPIPIAVVQGAVPQNLKWQADNRDATMARYLRLTQQAWGARLIVWPESAMPVVADEIPDYLENLHQLGRTHGADFAIGLVDYQQETQHYFNGLLVMSSGGGGKSDGGWYYKRHLVPFGEYFPVPPVIRSWMRLMSLPYDDFTPGSEHQPTLSAAGQKLGLTICYEDAFGSSQLPILREATLLVNVTNNAWFGDSTAPHQHLQIARMRALEAGRFEVRAANDGITAVIDPHGKIIAQAAQFKEAVLRADVQPMSGLTPYARLGNYPVVLGAAMLLAFGAWRRRHG